MSATILLAANPLPLALVTYLEDLGYEVATVEDGCGLLGTLGRRTPDLLIVDADTLMTSDLGTCHGLRCALEQRGLPVVMTSARAGLREQSARHLVGAKVVLNTRAAGEVAAVAEGLLGSAQVYQVTDARLWRTAS